MRRGKRAGGRNVEAGMALRARPFAVLALASTLAALSAAAPPAQAVTVSPGGWSYFGDPRAVRLNGVTYLGWAGQDGYTWVASIAGSTVREITRLEPRLSVDDHNSPSLVVRPDGRIMVFYAPHSGNRTPKIPIPKRLYYRLSEVPESVASFGPVEWLHTNTRGRLGYTYPNPIQLAGGELWLFWRGGNWQPSFSTSADGSSWSRARTLLVGARRDSRYRHRPYVKYAASGGDTIHFAFTEASPQSRPTSLYYARYRNGAFYRAGGRRIGTLRSLPLRPRRADRIHDVRSEKGRAWVMDVAADHEGRPVVVYAAQGRRIRYRYARWDGTRWRTHHVTDAGRSPRSGYSGGVSLDHDDPTTAYLSREVNGVREIELWRTHDGGRTWFVTPVTQGSEVGNHRPVAPRGLVDGTQLFWMRGRYVSYGIFSTSIVEETLEAP
jgi:BNR repeat-containing family member